MNLISYQSRNFDTSYHNHIQPAEIDILNVFLINKQLTVYSQYTLLRNVWTVNILKYYNAAKGTDGNNIPFFIFSRLESFIVIRVKQAGRTSGQSIFQNLDLVYCIISRLQLKRRYSIFKAQNFRQLTIPWSQW